MKGMKIYCDGGARGNPGPAASAFVAVDSEGNTIHKDAKFLGVSTNNVAEYEALIMALKWLAQNEKEKATIVLDSELVKKQMTGEYKLKNPVMREKAMAARALAGKLSFPVTYIHTAREGNAEADRLVNEALNAHLGH